ncbi:Zinc finger, C3HC4 RING-type [Dillenia turbinata]|uniref:RING-type E3 ubiquitin transferase (cysteine targeting) n=1 Tax=Dillenia turbinata TaxID=194707 RepID=A0AAN8YTP9_9MAGN
MFSLCFCGPCFYPVCFSNGFLGLSPVRTGLEGPGLSAAQKLWYCIASVGGQYIWARLQSFSAFRRWGDSDQRSFARRAWIFLQRIEGIYKAASFMNLLLFLYSGKDNWQFILAKWESFVSSLREQGSVWRITQHGARDEQDLGRGAVCFWRKEKEAFVEDLRLVGKMRNGIEQDSHVTDYRTAGSLKISFLIVLYGRAPEKMGKLFWYKSLIERVLRARLVYESPNMNRAVSFEYMNRQLVWNEFSEMLLLLIPLLNSTSIRNFLRPFSRDKSSSSSEDENVCPICQANPTTAFLALPCQHRYCYYCLRTRCSAAPSFRCSRCNEPVVAMQRHSD